MKSKRPTDFVHKFWRMVKISKGVSQTPMSSKESTIYAYKAHVGFHIRGKRNQLKGQCLPCREDTGSQSSLHPVWNPP
ncbi:MAG: hypothetical protein ACJAYR_002951 [Sneathiella sp.]|jgi:hypothetical protein